MTEQKYIQGIVKGYKATDKDMKCRGLQYAIGVWQEVAEGDIIKCGANGLHFCEHPSGVWSYYNEPGTRVFRCEAEYVLEEPTTPGADRKLVARRLRLVEEIVIDGYYNTGNYNTGNYNTGDYNTGYYNTGNYNTGYYNTGYYNTGDYNTGYYNTGYYNTGDYNTGNYNTGNYNTGYYNTGYYNTGDYNTGNYNTGYRNTGNYNTGYRNTGYYNTGNYNTGNYNTGYYNTGYGNAANNSSGFFEIDEPKVSSFGTQTELTKSEFMQKYPEYYDLCLSLGKDDQIPITQYENIPGITQEKLLALHSKHIEGRKKAAK